MYKSLHFTLLRENKKEYIGSYRNCNRWYIEILGNIILLFLCRQILFNISLINNIFLFICFIIMFTIISFSINISLLSCISSIVVQYFYDSNPSKISFIFSQFDGGGTASFHKVSYTLYISFFSTLAIGRYFISLTK